MISSDDYKAGKSKPADIEQLDRWRWEVVQSTQWRLDSALAEDFKDGHQYNNEELAELEDRGIPPVVDNMVGPTVDLVRGMEARIRTDWIAKPEADGWDDVALALSKEIKTVERLSYADDACSEAFGDEITAGLGWVEVARESDPFKFPYRVKRRDWREFWWDPHSEEWDMSDAKFILRRRFYDREQLEKHFPDKAKEIHDLGPGYSNHFPGNDGRWLSEPETLTGAAYGPWRDYTRYEQEWLDLDRDRIELEEAWYRVWVRGKVLQLVDGTSIEYDKKNEMHNVALERGAAMLRNATWSEIRCAMWAGPLQLMDIPSPHPHRNYPYVPFWGLREARTGSPYGLVRRMIPLQREVNARRSKMLWGLSAKRVYATAGAVADHDLARQQASRPDSYFILSDKPNQSFKVDDNLGINQQQYEVYLNTRQALQDAAGVYQAMLGKESAAESGVAIANLVEQGSTTLAPLMRNFKRSRERVGELVMALKIEDMAGREQKVKVKQSGSPKTIVLNKQTVTEDGLQVIENDVTKARMAIVLDDMPATPTFRAQQNERSMATLSKLPPEMQIQFLDLIAESWDVPNKEAWSERVREVLGKPKNPEEMTPEEQQAAQAQAEKAQQDEAIAQAGIQAQVELEQAKVRSESAKAENTVADTEKTAIDTEAVMVSMQKMMVDMQKTVAEIAVMNRPEPAAEASPAKPAPKQPAQQQPEYRW